MAGEARALRGDVLPTEAEIYKHYLHVQVAKESSGEWHRSVPVSTKIKSITEDVASVWNKTSIPHNLVGHEGERKVKAVITKVKGLDKIILSKRGKEFGRSLNQLFDVARCKCEEECLCQPENQVPKSWQEFLQDQRGERKLEGVLFSDRKLSLRAAAVKLEKDNVKKEKVALKTEMKKQQARKKQKLKDKSKTEKELMLRKDSLQECEDEERVTESIEEEWESEEADGLKRKRKFNLRSLPNFARACDRVKVSDYAAAMLGNSLLMDYGLVTGDNSVDLIDPSKVRRERERHGKVLEKVQRGEDLPQGIYTDGKRVPTLVREVRETKVAVPGGKGRGATRVVTNTSTQLKVQEHLPVVAFPCDEPQKFSEKYVTHLTPPPPLASPWQSSWPPPSGRGGLRQRWLELMGAASTQASIIVPSGCLSSLSTTLCSG